MRFFASFWLNLRRVPKGKQGRSAKNWQKNGQQSSEPKVNRLLGTRFSVTQNGEKKTAKRVSLFFSTA